MTRARLVGPRAAAVLLLLLAACNGKSPGHSVSAATYDRTCESAGECRPVFEGELDCCASSESRCANASVNEDAYLAFRNETLDRTPMCGAGETCEGHGCSGGFVSCPTGVCEFHVWSAEDPDTAAARAVSAADYSHACQDLVDCVAIYEGPLGCCNQGCPNAAIHQDDVARYMTDVGRRAPVCVPVPSCVPPDACPSKRIDCQNGVCVLLGRT